MKRIVVSYSNVKKKKQGTAGKAIVGTAIALGVIALLFEIGTLFPKIPVFGSIGSFLTMAYAHIALVVLSLLALVSLAGTFVKRLPKGRFVVFALFAAVCAINFYCFYASVADLDKQGADVTYNFFEYFKKEDVSDVKKDVLVYCSTPYGENELNVYYVEDGKADKPVILYIHGGGWVQGSKDDHTYESLLLAKRGFVVVSADYTLSDKDKHLAGETEEELTHAFAWVKKNVSSYGGNAEELYALGDSAGGNLALCMAYKINAGLYAEADGIALPHVKKTAVLYPVVSPKRYHDNEDIVLKWSARSMAEQYVGATPEEDPEGYQRVTATNYITEQTPPTLMIVGEGDTDVQPEQSYVLSAVLTASGIENKLVRVKYVNHAFDNFDGCFGCVAVVGEIEKFFR